MRLSIAVAEVDRRGDRELARAHRRRRGRGAVGVVRQVGEEPTPELRAGVQLARERSALARDRRRPDAGDDVRDGVDRHGVELLVVDDDLADCRPAGRALGGRDRHRVGDRGRLAGLQRDVLLVRRLVDLPRERTVDRRVHGQLDVRPCRVGRVRRRRLGEDARRGDDHRCDRGDEAPTGPPPALDACRHVALSLCRRSFH